MLKDKLAQEEKDLAASKKEGFRLVQWNFEIVFISIAIDFLFF